MIIPATNMAKKNQEASQRFLAAVGEEIVAAVDGRQRGKNQDRQQEEGARGVQADAGKPRGGRPKARRTRQGWASAENAERRNQPEQTGTDDDACTAERRESAAGGLLLRRNPPTDRVRP